MLQRISIGVIKGNVIVWIAIFLLIGIVTMLHLARILAIIIIVLLIIILITALSRRI